MIFFAILIASWILLITVVAWRLAEIKNGLLQIDYDEKFIKPSINDFIFWQKIEQSWKNKILPLLNNFIIKILFSLKNLAKKAVRIIDKVINRQIQRLGYVHKNVTPLDRNQNNAIS